MKSTLTAIGLFASVITLSAQPVTGARTNPKTTMQQARNAVRDHRLPDAVGAYERVTADSSRDAAKFKADAWYQLLLLRVSADPSVRDLQRGAAAATELQRAYPAHERAREIAAIAELLREGERLRDGERRAADEKQRGEQRLAESTAQAAAATARADGLAVQLSTVKQGDESGKLRQEAASLRTEIRNLRDRLAKSQAELVKKDEALRRVAGSLIKPK